MFILIGFWEHICTYRLKLINTHNHIENILIKVDVDGMDEEVIKGAVETIKRCKPLIIIEELKDSKGTPNHNGVAFLKQIGYKVEYLHHSTSLIHKDYIMVPKTL